MKRLSILALAAAFCLALNLPAAHAADKKLMMATTTSTQDSGLLEYLQPSFKAETGIDLKWVAVGTGKALEIAKNCDADVLLVHAPAAEMEFVKAGHGVDRRQIMYHDFVLVGTAQDPAQVKGKTAAEALKAIAGHKNPFVSRGDQSGTHKAELKLWKASSLSPDKEPWYVSAGQGMMATLNMAAEKKGYALTDRGTWIKFDNKQMVDLDYDAIEKYMRTSGSKVIQRKGATFYAIAISVCSICEYLFGAVDVVTTVSTMMHGEYGIEDVCLSIPTLLGPNGVEGKVTPKLTDEEVAKLRFSADSLKEVISKIQM